MDQLSEADQRTDPAVRAKRADDPPETFQEMVERIQGEAFHIMIERQKKYGPDNIKSMGETGVVVRLNDKMERLNRFKRNAELFEASLMMFNLGYIEGPAYGSIAGKISDAMKSDDEPIADTLHDIMNYALILLALRRDWWDVPLDQ